jgi:hypothetical protein
LILTGAAPAFARGGPGGALGSALEVLLIFGIVVGFVAGVICARLLRRPPWKTLALLSVVGFVIAVAFPFVGILFGIPALVSLAVFASVLYVVRGGVFRASDDDERTGASEAFRWIAVTYVFWAAISLVNFQLLAFLAVPPLVLVSPGTIGKFLPFILPPLAVALLLGIFVTALVAKTHASSRHVAPFIFNACVLVAFFVSAEIYRDHLMSQSLRNHSPDHLESSSFLSSVLQYRTYFRHRHGGFEENGKTYRWSYSERGFVERPRMIPVELEGTAKHAD